MPIEILATNESMFWTSEGLKKPKELTIDDIILGVDTSGDICWRTVTHVPTSRGSAGCNQIISDFTEIHAPQGIVLCIQSIDRRFCKIEEIETRDKLRIISNPAYVLEKWAYKKDSALSIDLAFLLGIAYRRVVLDQDKIVIKVPSERIDAVMRTLDRVTLCQKGSNMLVITADHGPIVRKRKSPWSWLIIESKQLPNLIKSYGDTREIPLSIRTDLKLYRSYVEGLIEVLGQREEDYVRFETFLDEYEARKLLYNLFFLYAVECKTNPTPSYSPDKIIISVKESALKRISSKPNADLRGKKSVSKVRWASKYKTSTYCVRVEGTNWSPIVDLVYIL